MLGRSDPDPKRDRVPGPRAEEADLMAWLAAGDIGSLDEIIARHWDVVVDYATRTIRCGDSAEDLAQEAFIALWERRRDWAVGSHPRPLLLKMVRHRALNERRWQEVRDRHDAKVRRIETARRPPDPFEEFNAREVEGVFRESLHAMSPRRREVFVLSRFQGLSYVEISEVLGTSPQTVANQMSEALQELRSALRAFESGRTATGS